VEVLALTVWVGGLVSIIAAVIPAVFSTIGMEAGGRMLSRMFQGYDRLVLVAGGMIVMAMLVRATITGNGIEKSEGLLLGAMIIVAAVLAFFLSPETVRLQEVAFSAKDEPAKKAAYDNFFMYHRVARALYVLNLVLGVIVLCRKTSRWVR
jgi:uncharacterized membrane protein